MADTVAGYCLMGCGQTLTLGAAGCVTCSRLTCPRPDAVTDLLADAEVHHIVMFGEDVFTVRHPLRERLDDALMECKLHEHLASLGGPPVRPGRYRALAVGAGWAWEEVA